MSRFLKYISKHSTYHQRFFFFALVFLGVVPLPVYWLQEIQNHQIARKEAQLMGIQYAKPLTNALYQVILLELLDDSQQVKKAISANLKAFSRTSENQLQTKSSNQLDKGSFALSRQREAVLLHGLWLLIHHEDAKLNSQLKVEIRNVLNRLSYDYDLILNRHPIENALSLVYLSIIPHLQQLMADLYLKGTPPIDDGYLVALEKLKRQYESAKAKLDNIVSTYRAHDFHDKAILLRAEELLSNFQRQFEMLIDNLESPHPDFTLKDPSFAMALETTHHLSNLSQQVSLEMYTHELYDNYFQKYSTWIILAIAGSIIIFFFSNKVLTKHMQALRGYIQNLAQGQYVPCFCSDAKDEFGPIGLAVDKMGKTVQRVLGELLTLSGRLTHSIEHITGTVKEQQEAVEAQEKAICEISSLAQSIANGSKNLSDVLIEGNGSSLQNALADSVKYRLEKLQGHMDVLEGMTSLIQNSMEQMRLKVSSAQTIIDFMHQVSNQARLLSFNAAIETATVQQQKENFEKVTQQLEHFSEKTFVATADIQDTVQALLKDVESVRRATNSCVGEIGEAITRLSYVNQQLNSIAIKGKEQIQAFEDVSRVMQEQAKAASEIIAALSKITASAKENSLSFANLHQTSLRLSGMAKDLDVVLTIYPKEKQHAPL